MNLNLLEWTFLVTNSFHDTTYNMGENKKSSKLNKAYTVDVGCLSY